MTYAESDTETKNTTFQAAGIVKTAEGTEIPFHARRPDGKIVHQRHLSLPARR